MKFSLRPLTILSFSGVLAFTALADTPEFEVENLRDEVARLRMVEARAKKVDVELAQVKKERDAAIADKNKAADAATPGVQDVWSAEEKGVNDKMQLSMGSLSLRLDFTMDFAGKFIAKTQKHEDAEVAIYCLKSYASNAARAKQDLVDMRKELKQIGYKKTLQELAKFEATWGEYMDAINQFCAGADKGDQAAMKAALEKKSKLDQPGENTAFSTLTMRFAMVNGQYIYEREDIGKARLGAQK